MDELKANTMTQAAPNPGMRTPPPLTHGAPPAAETKAPSSRLARIFLIVGVVIIALVIWKIFFATPSLPASIIALSGRIERDDSAVAPKTSGKILEITVREADTVTAGPRNARARQAPGGGRGDTPRAAPPPAHTKKKGQPGANTRPPARGLPKQ